MPQYIINWRWEEAFDKFGFEDGDGTIFTDDVANYLQNIGYNLITEGWGCHNTIIVSVSKDGVAQIPENANLGYDCPRSYLPAKIIKALDKRFPENGEE